MTAKTPPRLAVFLLHRFTDNEPLAGDLLEEFSVRRSRIWFWRQVVAAIVVGWFRRPADVRPLRLVDERITPLTPRPSAPMPRTINITASPIHGIGGAGILTLILVMTVMRPVAWSFIAIALAAGVLCGVARILFTRRRSRSEERDRTHVLMSR